MIKIPRMSPLMNAHAEAWIGTIKKECLDYFIVFGEDHLRYIINEYLSYYNTVRPHQSLGNVPLEGSRSCAGPPLDAYRDVGCDSRLGGLLKHYYRKAA